eukprot:scaffold15478_cov117-Isochrysis_galbana.AAC.3
MQYRTVPVIYIVTVQYTDRAGLTARCSGRRETDEEWNALELTLAGYITTPRAMEKTEHPPTISTSTLAV